MLSLIQVTYSSLFLIHIARCWAQVSRTAHDQATPQTTGTTRPSKARMRFLRRQNAFQDICPKVNDISLECPGDDVCVSTTSDSDVYLGCCPRGSDCVPYTTCVDPSLSQQTSTPNSLVMTCSDDGSFCVDYVWGSGAATSFSCGTAPTTIVIDITSSSTGSISTRSPTPTASSTTTRPPAEPSTPPESSPAAQDLNKEQRIGVGVGCGSAVLIIVAVITYCARGPNRKRRSGKNSHTSMNTAVSGTEKNDDFTPPGDRLPENH